MSENILESLSRTNDKLKARWCENCESNNEALRYESDCPKCYKKSHRIWSKIVIKQYPENSPSGQLCEKFSWMESESDLINARKNVSITATALCLVIVSWIFSDFSASITNAVWFVLFSENNWTASILITRILSLCNDSMLTTCVAIIKRSRGGWKYIWFESNSVRKRNKFFHLKIEQLSL